MTEQAVGRSVPRIDGKDKVSGRALYPTDLSRPGMLWLALVRADRPHARIRRLDTSALDGKEGVHVFTAADIPENSSGILIKDQPVLAGDRVRFYGEPVALVAAPTREAAGEWARQVRVDYEDLPVVRDTRDAPGAPVPLHGDSNRLQEFQFEKNDPAGGFAASDLILEDEFTVPMVDHAPLELEGGISYWDDGVLTLEVGTQNPFFDQAEIVHCLGLAPEQVRVRVPCVGGAFGGKDGNTVQLYLALVTWKTGQPAKMVFDRRESLLTTYKRHPARVKTRIGLSADGEIRALSARIDLDTGAYASFGPAVFGLSIEHCTGPYEIENVAIDASLYFTNKPPAGAMRGFGVPQVLFATETLLNRAARQLGLDPIALRRRNALAPGKTGSLGNLMEHSVGIDEALAILQESEFWRTRSDDPSVGCGMAAGFLSCGMGQGIPDSARVEIEQEGERIRVRLGCVDIGQGNYTAFAQMAATGLEVPLEAIDLVVADTRDTPNCGDTCASRTTFIVGNAMLAAMADFRAQRARGVREPRAAGQADFPEASQKGPLFGIPHSMYSFVVHAAKVRVDSWTGEPELVELFGVTEAGVVINPTLLAGQIEGGMAMGAGYCLSEQLEFDEGIPRQDSLATYLLPTSLDLCPIGTAVVESREESGPYGVKGAAEAGTVAVAPAITEAVAVLTGYSATGLPLSREKILDACMEQKIRKGAC